MSLQLDFGGFDPAFLGVSINFQNLRVRELHKQFSESPTPIPVAQLPDDERFTALSIFSVMAHETRHFHDFFLTSYSAHVFFYRVQMVVNLLQVIPYFRKKGPNCLPVPMLKWCRMDAAGRQDELQWLGPRHDGKPWVPVNLPLLKGTEFVAAGGLAADVDALTPLLVAVLNRRDKIRDLTFNADTVRGQTSFQPWQVFELSALVVQFHEIEAMYGLDAALFWVNHLVGLGNTPYASVLKLVVSLWDDSKEPVDFHLVSAIVWWCLLGSFAVDSWNACPTHRFVHLFKHLKTTGLPSDVSDVLLLFDRWSQRTGLSKVRQGLVEARDRFRATRANLAA